MALINTLYTFGWYGVESGCSSFDLRANIGTYVIDDPTNAPTVKRYVGPFETEMASSDPENLDFGVLGFLTFWGYQNGNAVSWSIKSEYSAFTREGAVNRPPSPAFDTLECGRMYQINHFDYAQAEINIPGFIPSTEGVDMGRIKV